MLPPLVRWTPTLVDFAEHVKLVQRTQIDVDESHPASSERAARRRLHFGRLTRLAQPPPRKAFRYRDKLAVCAGAGYSYGIDQPQILSWIESFL